MKRLELDVIAELLPTDRIFQRWARSVGCGIPEPEWDGTPAAQANELPPDAAIWVDRYVCTAPERMRRFIHSWYRSQDDSSVIARRFGCGRHEVYVLWRAYLHTAKPDFEGEPCVSSLMEFSHAHAA